MLKRLKAQSITILVSTPYMDEAAMCDRIALIHGGRILSIDTPANISASYPYQLIAIKSSKMSTLLKALRGFDKTKNSYAFGEYAHVAIDKSELTINNDLKTYLQKEGIENIEIKKIPASVEDYFIKAMGSLQLIK